MWSAEYWPNTIDRKLEPEDTDIVFLGQMAIQGERGLLQFSCDWLLRLRYNPFYDFLEARTLEWMAGANGGG